MNSTNKLVLIGLLCIVVIAACWLAVLYEHKQTPNIPSVSSTSGATTHNVVIGGTSTSTSTSASTTASMSGALTLEPVNGVINTTGMQFEVVTTIAAQNKGLGDRATIPDDYAMLFVFPQDGYPGFWMKDMLSSIDMIWLTDNGTIVAIDPSVSPDTYPAVFYPPQPIKYVLETRAGFAAEHGWHVGTRVGLPTPYGSGAS